MLFIVQRLAGVSQCPDFNDISFDDLERFVYSKGAVVRDIALSKVILFWLKCHPGFIGTSMLAEVFFQLSLRIVDSGRGNRRASR